MNLLTAPFKTFTSLALYRDTLKLPLTKGFLYLLWLSVVLSVIFWLSLAAFFLPQSDKFIAWLEGSLPPMMLTSEGLVLESGEPYTLVHPEWGTLARFDTSQASTGAPVPDMSELFVFVSATRMTLKDSLGRVASYDLKEVLDAYLGSGRAEEGLPARQNEGGPAGQAGRLDPSWVGRAYRQMKPWVYVTAGIFSVPFFYAMNLISAVFFSWFALLINLFRREKLSYGQLFTLSIFANTPAGIFQNLQLLIPFLAKLPFAMPGQFMLTTTYLYLAILWTQEETKEERAE